MNTVTAHCVGCPVAGLNLETGQQSHYYIAEISLNVTLNNFSSACLELKLKVL